MGYLLEYITVGRGTQLTDWHEEILTPGWEWNDVVDPFIALIVDNNFGGVLPGLSFNRTSTKLDFSFDAILPGTQILIQKELEFVGVDDSNDEEIFEGSVVIREYPTIPEPSTFILLGAGLAGLAFWRKRRA